ncbi:MAG: Gfo/Idh/MocA family oxidoreductase [Holosporaceae bacterium]|nr:Gfo/Idh/MocA family oxidoreductase [Holosporaceae bacterium]
MLNTIIIGVGGQSQKDYLPFMTNSSRYNLVAICDKNEKLLNEISQQYNVPGFLSLGDLLKEINNVDVAIVAVPHNAYLGIIKELVANGIHIIKEKPFATSAQEAIEIHECMKSSNVLLGVAMKRRFSPVFKAFLEFKKKIGRIYLVEGCYVMNIKRLDEGWRASKNQSGGGALVDLGYHYIDLIVWYMGIPRTATARMSGKSRVGQEYDVEDTVSLMLDYASNDSDDSDQKTVVNLVISRNYHAKKE